MEDVNGTLGTKSWWRGTSYKKLLNRTREVLELANLTRYTIDMYPVQIVFNQDYNKIKELFEQGNGYDDESYHISHHSTEENEERSVIYIINCFIISKKLN